VAADPIAMAVMTPRTMIVMVSDLLLGMRRSLPRDGRDHGPQRTAARKFPNDIALSGGADKHSDDWVVV
jgi:hypothetical protein